MARELGAILGVAVSGPIVATHAGGTFAHGFRTAMLAAAAICTCAAAVTLVLLPRRTVPE